MKSATIFCLATAVVFLSYTPQGGNGAAVQLGAEAGLGLDLGRGGRGNNGLFGAARDVVGTASNLVNGLFYNNDGPRRDDNRYKRAVNLGAEAGLGLGVDFGRGGRGYYGYPLLNAAGNVVGTASNLVQGTLGGLFYNNNGPHHDDNRYKRAVNLGAEAGLGVGLDFGRGGRGYYGYPLLNAAGNVVGTASNLVQGTLGGLFYNNDGPHHDDNRHKRAVQLGAEAGLGLGVDFGRGGRGYYGYPLLNAAGNVVGTASNLVQGLGGLFYNNDGPRGHHGDV